MSIIYEPKGRAKEYANLAVNLYRGCGHKCLYCYCPQILKMTKENFHKPEPRKDIIKKLEKDCLGKDLSGKSILLSFTSDPYQPINDEFQLTRQAINLIHSTGANIEILTKGGLRAENDFWLYKDGDKFGTTLTFKDWRKSIKWEDNAADPCDRIEAIKRACEMNIKTWVSLEPIIEPKETYELIEASQEYTDFYKIGKLNYMKTDVDWHIVLENIVKLMEKYNKKYYIKKDLMAYR